MGEIITPPDDEPPFGPVGPGADCVNCWGIGKPFGSDDTPDKIQVKVSGVNKGPNWHGGNIEPPNGTYILNQIIGLPCAYRFAIPLVSLQVVFNVGNTGIIGIDKGIPDNWFFAFGGICDTEMDNAENDHFVGGSAVITIPETT